MPTLKYTGQSHFREFKKSDFNHHEGVEGETVKIARHDIFPEDNFKNYSTTADVSQETADWLLENEPGDWAVVEDKEEKAAAEGDDESADVSSDDNSSAPNASDAPAGSPDTVPASPRRAAGGSSTRTR